MISQLKYFVNQLQFISKSLGKRELLVDKPWALIDEDGEIQKLIFKQNKEMILSKNGKVTIGSWDYFPGAKSLLIDRGRDKLLLNEQLIDENVLILKKDGTDNEFFALANENTLPDYNILGYLQQKKSIEFKTTTVELIDNRVLEIYNPKETNYFDKLIGNRAILLDKNNLFIDNSNGTFLTKDKKQTFIIHDGYLQSVKKNRLLQLINGNTVEVGVGDGYITSFVDLLNKSVTINGVPLPDSEIIDFQNVLYVINESRISQFYFLKKVNLAEDRTITLKQKKFHKISRGDEILRSSEQYPIKDGGYKIKELYKWIRIQDQVVVKTYGISTHLYLKYCKRIG